MGTADVRRGLARASRGRFETRSSLLARGVLAGYCLALGLLFGAAQPGSAQEPSEGEVRQLVTFSFLPGQAGAAIDLYRAEAVPLYRRNEPMLSFRAFREVESPIPLDLMVVSAFDGMAGMDESNERLRALAAEAGTPIGALYGQIGAHSSGHTDQFVRMLPVLGQGDPSETRLTAFVWYRVVPGRADAFEEAIRDHLVPLERASNVPSSTGRFLISDGWHYLRMLGFEDLSSFQEYWEQLGRGPAADVLEALTARRREVVLAGIEGLSVR